MSSKSRVVDGDSQFTGGMNSQTDPKQLTAGFYKSAMNMLNRGGVLQCRPGYDWRFNLACGDNLQGGILFTPLDGGLEAIIYAVDGQIYFSRYPFVETEHINGLSFRSDAVHVHFEVCEKAAERNADGSLKLVSPYKVVIIQDGFTAPGAWDGGYWSAPLRQDGNETRNSDEMVRRSSLGRARTGTFRL